LILCKFDAIFPAISIQVQESSQDPLSGRYIILARGDKAELMVVLTF